MLFYAWEWLKHHLSINSAIQTNKHSPPTMCNLSVKHERYSIRQNEHNRTVLFLDLPFSYHSNFLE